MTSITRVSIILFDIFFRFLVPLEILSYYPIIDSSLRLKDEVQLIKDQAFKVRFMVLSASTLTSRNFLINFLFLPAFAGFFIVIRLIVMTYWWLRNNRYPCLPIDAEVSAFIEFRWKLNIKTKIMGFSQILRSFNIFVHIKFFLVNL